jgi:hypothetical protein
VTDLIEGPSLRLALAEAGAFDWPRAASLRQALDAVSALMRGGYICGVNRTWLGSPERRSTIVGAV